MTDSILVAGAIGVIGRHAAGEYVARGARVRGVSRRPRPSAAERGSGLTVMRPEGGVGHPTSLLRVIAVHAAVCRELGQPLRFPGTVAAHDALCQVTNPGLRARARVWAGAEPQPVPPTGAVPAHSERYDELVERRVIPPAA